MCVSSASLAKSARKGDGRSLLRVSRAAYAIDVEDEGERRLKLE